MYTCIAYLLKFDSFAQKTWFIKMLIRNPKCSKTHLRAPLISKNSGGYTPGPPLKRGRRGEGRRGMGQGRGGPQFTLLATPLRNATLARYMLSSSVLQSVCPSVCLSGVLSKPMDESSCFLSRKLSSTCPTLCHKEIWVPTEITVLPSGTSS